jgi:hypothetical protein
MVIRLIALLGFDGMVRRVSFFVYGELLTVVSEIEEFAA